MAQDPAFPNAGSVSFGEDPIYRLLDDLISAGVVGATDYQVIQNHLGANMSVDVQPGNGYVGITNGGKRRTRLPAQSNSGIPGTPNAADNWLTTFTAADATNPRVDRVVLTVRDSSIDGSGAFNSALRVIAGTPTAAATLVNLNGAAAVPPNSILLANVLVPNSATTIITANIADVRTTAKIGGNVPGGSVRHGARAKQVVAQSLTSAVVGGTAVTLDGEDWDSDGYHDNVTNNTRLTIPSNLGGIYLLTGGLALPNPGSAARVTSMIRKNGATYLAGGGPTDNYGPANQVWTSVAFTDLAVPGDYYELMGVNTEATQNIVAASAFLSATYLSP